MSSNLISDKLSVCSLMVERSLDKTKVIGSNPILLTFNSVMAEGLCVPL